MGTPLTFSEVLNNCVIYSISKAWCLGRAIQRGRLAKTDLVNSILDSVRSKLIINGKVTAKGQLCMYVMQLVTQNLIWQLLPAIAVTDNTSDCSIREYRSIIAKLISCRFYVIL